MQVWAGLAQRTMGGKPQAGKAGASPMYLRRCPLLSTAMPIGCAPDHHASARAFATIRSALAARAASPPADPRVRRPRPTAARKLGLIAGDRGELRCARCAKPTSMDTYVGSRQGQPPSRTRCGPLLTCAYPVIARARTMRRRAPRRRLQPTASDLAPRSHRLRNSVTARVRHGMHLRRRRRPTRARDGREEMPRTPGR